MKQTRGDVKKRSNNGKQFLNVWGLYDCTIYMTLLENMKIWCKIKIIIYPLYPIGLVMPRLEEWLRCLLDWNPDTRGKDQTNGQIVVFSQLEKIIRQLPSDCARDFRDKTMADKLMMIHKNTLSVDQNQWLNFVHSN